MKFEIKIVNTGDIKNERVVLKALEDFDIGYYIIARSSLLSENKISDSIDNVFWLPAQIIKKDDLVVLYTRKGSNSNRQNDNGSKTYFYYLNLENPIYEKPIDCAILLELNNWKTVENKK